MKNIEQFYKAPRFDFIQDADYYLEIVDKEDCILITDKDSAQYALMTLPMFEDCFDDFGLLINSAVRYALGRLSYLPERIATLISNNLNLIDDRTLQVISKDIREYGCPASDWNSQCWMSLLEKLEKIAAERGLGQV